MKSQKELVQESLCNHIHKHSGTASSNSNTEQTSKASADNLIQWIRSYSSERINSRLIDERRSIPPYIVLDMGNNGLLSMQVPIKYNGLELNNYDQMRIFEQLGSIDQTIASFVGINNVLGIRPIMTFATEEVKQEALPILAQGRELASFAITEIGAGSNPRKISATATPSSIEGKWLLNGTKVWSGSASWAGFINIIVKNINQDGMSNGINAFVVRQGSKGLRQGAEALTMGMRGMVQNSVHLENVEVTKEQLLGTIGRGMEVAQNTMSYGRLSIAAGAVGSMKKCAQLMLRYGSSRNISTGRLLDNPVSLIRLTELAASINAVETLVYKVSKILDQGGLVPEEIFAACKTSAPEFLFKATDYLIQMMGGRGYIETNIAPQFFRDARLQRIFEGPTETLLMYLGSSVIHKNENFYKFIINDLCAQNTSELLKEAASQIEARWISSKRYLIELTTSTRWAYILAGEVATYYILHAAVSGELNLGKDTIRLKKTSIWCKIKAEQALRKALQGVPSETIIENGAALTEIISNYSETIGDLKQNLVGEDHEIDSSFK